MDVRHLSQKQKLVAYTVILCIGFVVMASFIATKLSDMTNKYEQSGVISQGAGTLFETQAKLLMIAALAEKLSKDRIAEFDTRRAELKKEVTLDVQFLQKFGFNNKAKDLVKAITQYDEALTPWLSMKSELGFSKDGGLRGRVRSVIHSIHTKIQETGMVTVVSEFQEVVKAQNNYLLSHSGKTEKLLQRANIQFLNISKTYSMLEMYEKELTTLGVVFNRKVDLSQKLKKVNSDVDSARVYAQKVMESASSQLIEMSHRYQHNAHNEANEAKLSVLVACFALAIITILIFVMISVSMTRSLKQTTQMLDKVSRGDLSQRLLVTLNANDEFNQLSIAINNTCEHLGKLVCRVQVSSGELSGDSASLNEGLDRLVQAQSDVLHQTEILASATEEVSVTAQEVSNSLENVANVSRQSTLAAEKGGVVIESAIKSLEEVGCILQNATQHTQLLEKASTKVDSVMDIINGIAEQTNLLALNAAIEAARAGDQGRGFAVVADEVRSLAVRTVDAVVDISKTIETMKKESTEVIQYIEHSGNTVIEGQEKGLEARLALSDITEKANETTVQTEVIVSSIKELAHTSHSMADNMVEIASLMKTLEEHNETLRKTSQIVDERSSCLSKDCQTFSI